MVFAPFATDSDPNVGDPGVTKVAEGGMATGVFAIAITGLTPGTAYSFKAYAMNAYGTSHTNAGTFTTLTPIQSWKLTHLGNANEPDLGDPDGDGLLTLAEYGLVFLPQTPGIAPAASTFTYAEGERLRIFIQRDPAHGDVTVEVQANGDLTGLWTTVATSTLGAPFSGPGYVGGDSATPGTKTVEIRDTVNIGDAPARYLRVKVMR